MSACLLLPGEYLKDYENVLKHWMVLELFETEQSSSDSIVEDRIMYIVAVVVNRIMVHCLLR